jgi:hypothetical protein
MIHLEFSGIWVNLSATSPGIVNIVTTNPNQETKIWKFISTHSPMARKTGNHISGNF